MSTFHSLARSYEHADKIGDWRMKKFLICLTMAIAPAFSFAGHSSSDAIVGGGLGGVLGAVVGNEIGGRDGAIIGGAIGAAAGVAITTDKGHHRTYYPRKGYGHYDHRDGYYGRDRYYGYKETYYRRNHHHFYAPPHGHFVPPGQAKKGRW
jgi:hypothetical protein